MFSLAYPQQRRLWPLLFATVPFMVQAAPLSYPAALDAAERNAPELAARAAGVAAARAAAIPAGALPDPKLLVGVDNLPVSGADRWRLNRDFMTMQKIGLSQELPNAAKRQARGEAAQAAVARSEAERGLARLTVRREVADAWLARYYLEQKLARLDELAQQNELLAEARRAQLAGGRSGAAEALLARQEAAALAERRDELERDRRIAVAALRRWLGDEGEAPLVGEPPAYPVEAELLHQHLMLHPELTVAGQMASQTKAELKEAEAGRRPDWGVEFAYQRRNPQYGDMVSVQFSLDLPLWQGSRQGPRIAAKQAELARVDAEREALLREHRQALDSDLAEYARLQSALTRQHETSLPLAQQRAELQLAGYRAGRVALDEVLSARRELGEARLKEIDLESQRARLAARLHFAYGEAP
ncbi:TolC family protein [Chitinimonas sp.]|uniref:TolC family protein n=1 Tax=Chitinimonas sp. TaxID=1934313 RepID=UPI002F95F6F8